jgi:Ca-activated chloride channel family protein
MFLQSVGANMDIEPEAEVGTREDVEGLSIQATAGRSAVLSGVRSSVRVLLNIQTPEGDAAVLAARRPPLHVACVLDRSYSMDGQKLRYAKKACTKLVKHLESGRDSLHFITYGDHARVVFQNGDLSEAGKLALRSEIESVRVSGSTNLFAGLESAVGLLKSSSNDGKVDNDGGALRRIFLFSDGNVNRGVTDRTAILESVRAWASEGIEISTFGIGADFDEVLMRKIAEDGKGRYAYLATAEDIPKLVSKSIHDLLDIYASDAVLDIRGESFSTVTRIYGAESDEVETGDPLNPTGATPGVLHLGDLHYSNQRRVLFELDVAPPGSASESFDAAEWTISLQRNGTSAQYSGRVSISPTRDRAALGTEAVPVAAAFAIQRSAELDRQVALHLANGARDKAREVKEQQISLLQATLRQVQEASDTNEADVLERVLERAQRVAEQLQDLREEDNSDIVRRHCVQEMELCRAMSVAGFRSGCDSDCSDSGDIANLNDVQSPPSSPRSVRSSEGSIIGSPRPALTHDLARVFSDRESDGSLSPPNSPRAPRSPTCSPPSVPGEGISPRVRSRSPTGHLSGVRRSQSPPGIQSRTSSESTRSSNEARGETGKPQKAAGSFFKKMFQSVFAKPSSA